MERRAIRTVLSYSGSQAVGLHHIIASNWQHLFSPVASLSSHSDFWLALPLLPLFRWIGYTHTSLLQPQSFLPSKLLAYLRCRCSTKLPGSISTDISKQKERESHYMVMSFLPMQWGTECCCFHLTWQYNRGGSQLWWKWCILLLLTTVHHVRVHSKQNQYNCHIAQCLTDGLHGCLTKLAHPMCN